MCGFCAGCFLNVCFTKGEFCKEASESNFGIHSWGVMPRRYEEQLQKRGRHRYRRNGIFEGFWLFLLYEGYQNNLSMMVIVSGGHQCCSVNHEVINGALRVKKMQFLAPF